VTRVTRNHDTARALRDAALVILRLKGHFSVDRDTGVSSTSCSDNGIRICHQPSIAGSAAPSVVDIWLTAGMIKVFTCYWFSAGRFEVISRRPGAWQAELLNAAAAPVKL
jgi:hypothetical protein